MSLLCGTLHIRNHKLAPTVPSYTQPPFIYSGTWLLGSLSDCSMRAVCPVVSLPGEFHSIFPVGAAAAAELSTLQQT